MKELFLENFHDLIFKMFADNYCRSVRIHIVCVVDFSGRDVIVSVIAIVIVVIIVIVTVAVIVIVIIAVILTVAGIVIVIVVIVILTIVVIVIVTIIQHDNIVYHACSFETNIVRRNRQKRKIKKRRESLGQEIGTSCQGNLYPPKT